MSKNRKPNPRGATPIAPKKVKKEWNVSLPSMPKIAWRWLLAPLFSGLLVFTAHWIYKSTPVTAIEFNGTFSVWNAEQLRSEERRVGKECRCRGGQSDGKKKRE